MKRRENVRAPPARMRCFGTTILPSRCRYLREPRAWRRSTTASAARRSTRAWRHCARAGRWCSTARRAGPCRLSTRCGSRTEARSSSRARRCGTTPPKATSCWRGPPRSSAGSPTARSTCASAAVTRSRRPGARTKTSRRAARPASSCCFRTDMGRLYAATGNGIARLDENGDAWVVDVSLRGSGAHCLAVDPAARDIVYAGLREGGVLRTTDAGRIWSDCALPARGVFSLAVSAADGAVYAGTEPSALYRSDDGGNTWRELDALLDLPSRPTWSFPPRPWTSHVRWIAPSPHDADLLLVGIELGGLMRSTDGGETWQDHRPGAQRDVHSLAWHPRAHARAYEAGGGGAAFSKDAGESWRSADEGRDRHYTWSVAVDPLEPECWYVSASTGPYAAHGRGDPQARIYRRSAGESWRALAGGLPEPLPA